MAGRWMIVCAAIFATVAASEIPRIVKFEAENKVVSPRQTIVLRCEFANLQFHSVEHLNKHLPNKTYKLTTDADFNYEIERYSFQTEDLPNSITRQTLAIRDALPVDSGNYSCSLMNRITNVTEWKYLEIAVEDQPDGVRIFLDDVEILNGTAPSAPLKLLTTHRIRCETTGSNPGANVTVKFGDKELHQCNKTISKPYYNYDKKGEEEFLVPVQYNTTVEVNHWKLDTDAYGSSVNCSAWVDYDVNLDDEPAISIMFRPEVADDAPQIECPDKVFVVDKQPNYVINCTVFSKPTLQDADFFFTVGTKAYRIEGYPFNTSRYTDDSKFSGVVQRVNEIKSIMNLTISMVDVKAQIKFNFEVKNAAGADIHSVAVLDKSSIPISVATSLSSPAYVLYLVVFAAAASVLCFRY